MSKEIELKMVVLPAVIESALPELLERLGAKAIKETWLVNTYFDTPEMSLNKSRVALRVRQKDGLFIQTLKTKGNSVAGLHRRGEWEWVVPENKLDAALLVGGVWPSEISTDDLIPFFETNFKRTSAIIECAGTKIELAVDCGYINAGEKQVPLSEVELEIIEGDAGHLFEVAEIIAEIMPVMPSDVSKAEQGYRLGQEVFGSEFLSSLNCMGDYRVYVKELVARNLTRWLYLFDRARQGCSEAILREMRDRLIVLRELLSTQGSIDLSVVFEGVALFDIVLGQVDRLIGVAVHGCAGRIEVYEQLLSLNEMGVLAIKVGRWLNDN